MQTINTLISIGISTNTLSGLEKGFGDLEKFRKTLAKLGTAEWSSQNKIAITSSTRVGDELLLPTNSLKIMNEDAVITQEGGVTRS